MNQKNKNIVKTSAHIKIPVSWVKNVYIVLITLGILFFIFDRTNGDQSVKASDTELYLADKAALHIDDLGTFTRKIRRISKKLDIAPEWLMAVIYNESKFNCRVYNYIGSGAVGLLQFMPSTASDLGTTSKELAEMDAVSQLDYVQRYLKGVMQRQNVRESGINSLTDLYLAVLYPKAIGKDYCYSMYSSPSRQYVQNKILDVNKDKSVTISDIDEYLKRKYPTAMIVTNESND